MQQSKMHPKKGEMMAKTISKICSELNIEIVTSTNVGNTSRLMYKGVDLGYINPEVRSAEALFGYKFRFDDERDGFSKSERPRYKQMIESHLGIMPIDWYYHVKSKDRIYLLIGDAPHAERILKLEVEIIDKLSEMRH